jgi:8-oxo-dGTP pyrophosphatase MutT (NUDIX family)
MRKERSAGIIIFKKENGEIYYLLLRAKFKSEYWEFPKGLIEEKDENPLEAAKREVWEETGIRDVRFIKNFIEKIDYFYRRNGELINKEVTFFLAECLNQHVNISDEHLEYKWVRYDEARKMLRDKLKEILDKANSAIKRYKKEMTLFDFK